MDKKESRKPVTMRLDRATRKAIREKAAEIGSSQANAVSFALGTYQPKKGGL